MGLWRICTRLRQDRIIECCSTPSGPTPLDGAAWAARVG
jgi:hypothetical protein